MIFGKYGNIILTNMEKNYPYRKQELELTGELNLKIFEREKYILKLKEQVEKQIKEKYKAPDTHEISVLAKYQKMIDGLVDEALMKDILQKIQKLSQKTSSFFMEVKLEEYTIIYTKQKLEYATSLF